MLRGNSSCLWLPEIADVARPSLARGVRLQSDGTTGKKVLLYPEGIVELNETAQEILSRCNGRHWGKSSANWPKSTRPIRPRLLLDVRETLADLQRRKLVEFT